MPTVVLNLTDAQFDAIAAGAAGKGTLEERVTAYLQAQVDTIASQHVLREEAKRFQAAGLPSSIVSSGLDDEAKALLLAHAEAKVAAAKVADATLAVK